MTGKLMAEKNAGEARLKIVPDASEFRRRLDADMKKIDMEFKLPVVPTNFAQATADIDRWIRQQSRKNVEVGIKVDERATERANREVKKLTADWDKAFSALKWNAGALAVGSLPAVATALTTVAAAIQQVSQAGLVMPGVLAGIGASFGVAKLATVGMGDALKALDKASDGTAKSIAAADKALSGLSTNQADAVKAIFGAKGAFEDLKKLAGQNMFAGFSTGFKQLVASDLPSLTKGVDGISKALGQNLNQTMKSLGSPSSQGILDRIFGNTANAQGRLTKAIDPIIHAIGTLTAAGTDALPRLADAVGKVADRFDKFITAADADRRLSKWINDGLTGLTHLGDTVLNLGTSFTAITKAAGGGEGLLGTLDKGSKKLSEFLNSDQGQAALKNFFREGREQLDKWLPVLQNLAQTLPGVFAAARDTTNALLPVIDSVLSVINSIPGGVQAVATAFLTWKTITGVTDLVTNIGKVATALGLLPGAAAAAGSGAAAGLAPLAAAIAPIAAAMAVITGGGIIGGKSYEDAIKAAGGPDTSAGKNVTNQEFSPGFGIPGAASDPAFAAPPPTIPGGGDANAQRQRRGSGDQFVDPTGGLLWPPGHATGGPTLNRRNGPTGGYIAELHPDEWVLPAHARKAVGDDKLWALTKGRSFAPGGYVDQNGNPVTANTTGPIAPNPTAGNGGILQNIIGGIASGMSGPIGNAMSIGQGIVNAAPGAGGGIGAAAKGAGGGFSLGDRFAQVPGLFGLLGSLGSSNPGDNLMNWGSQTGQWLGNFTAKTVGGFATALWQGGLDFFGLGNSILSPNNSWNQAGQSLGDFAFGSDGPLGKLLGANDGAGSSSSSSTSSSSSASDRPGSRVISGSSVSSVGSGLVAGAKYSPGAGANQWRSLVTQIVASRGLGPGWVDPLLRQIQTESGGNPRSVNANDSNGRGGTQRVEGLFNFLPSTFTGNGGRNIWDPADQINTAITYVQGRYGQTNGVPNWIGVPGRGFAVGGAAQGPGGPKSDLIPAMLSNGEHVLTAEDVVAMGGQGNVMKFRSALHRAGGGSIQLMDLIKQGSASPNPGDPTLGGSYRPHRIFWWGGEGWTPPRSAGPGDPLVPWGPNRDGKMVPPNIFGGMPGEWPPNNDFPVPGDSRDIWRGNRRGVAGFKNGGGVGFPAAMIPSPNPAPPMPTTQAQFKNTPPPPPVSVAPSQSATPAVSAASTAGIGSAATSAPGGFYGGNANVAPAPTNLNHNLPAISQGIASTASVLGNLASQAIGAGMASAGLPGGAQAGQFVDGLIKEGGKVVDSAVNVASSFLVGSVPGSMGSQDRMFGQTVFPQQNAPVTAPLRGGSVTNFNGISDIDRIAQYLDLRDAQSRAGLAHYGG